MTLAMNTLGVVKRNITRADRAATAELARFGTSTVHEAMGRVGLMKPYMRPIYPGARIAGTAVTVLLHPGDNWMMHVVAEQIQPGDIVVAAITADCTVDAPKRASSAVAARSARVMWRLTTPSSNMVRVHSISVVYRNIKRADRAAADGLAALGSATVHEAMGRVGLMKPYMRPIYAGAAAR